MNGRRVVVTGLSAVTPIGIGREANWDALMNGRSGVAPITQFDASSHRTQIAAEISDFSPEEYFDKKELRSMERFSQFGVLASKEAFEQSGWVEDQTLRESMSTRIGVLIGCGLGGLFEIENSKQTLLEKGPRRVSPFFIPKVIGNMAGGLVAIRYGLRGPNFATTSACSSGAHAIGEAYRMIQSGAVDVMLAGGAESTISPLCIAGFDAMKALSPRNEEPQRASRPFDKNRDGFVVGEGSGVLILEEYELAKKRGASILAELVGYGANCDAYHITAPIEGGEGAAEAMRISLESAHSTPEQIGSINAHGTSTGLGDIAETKAIKKVFDEHAKSIQVTSTKSMVGHTLGAAGGIESVYSIMGLQHQAVPPTINLEQPDPECDLSYVANEMREFQHEYVLSNSFGFGGTNACLIFRRFS